MQIFYDKKPHNSILGRKTQGNFLIAVNFRHICRLPAVADDQKTVAFPRKRYIFHTLKLCVRPLFGGVRSYVRRNICPYRCARASSDPYLSRYARAVTSFEEEGGEYREEDFSHYRSRNCCSVPVCRVPEAGVSEACGPGFGSDVHAYRHGHVSPDGKCPGKVIKLSVFSQERKALRRGKRGAFSFRSIAGDRDQRGHHCFRRSNSIRKSSITKPPPISVTTASALTNPNRS